MTSEKKWADLNSVLVLILQQGVILRHQAAPRRAAGVSNKV